MFRALRAKVDTGLKRVNIFLFLQVKLLETKLQSNKETREESYGGIKLESSEQTTEQSYGETKLESNEQTREQNTEELS